MSDWISWGEVDEVPQGKVLIIYLESFFGELTQEVGVGYYDDPNDHENPEDGQGWLFWLGDKKVLGGGVTHWMPLPELPEAK